MGSGSVTQVMCFVTQKPKNMPDISVLYPIKKSEQAEFSYIRENAIRCIVHCEDGCVFSDIWTSWFFALKWTNSVLKAHKKK